MKRRIALFATAVGLSVTGLVAPARSQSPTGITVQLFQFHPSALEVGAGTRIVLMNQDDIEHTVTSGMPGSPDGQFEVKLSGKGATRQLTLTKPGVYPYFCSRHQSMRGEFRVQ